MNLEARAANTLTEIYAELPEDAQRLPDNGIDYRGTTLYLGINYYGPGDELPVIPEDEDITYQRRLYETWVYDDGSDDFHETEITDDDDEVLVMLDDIKQDAIERFHRLAINDTDDEN